MPTSKGIDERFLHHSSRVYTNVIKLDVKSVEHANIFRQERRRTSGPRLIAFELGLEGVSARICE